MFCVVFLFGYGPLFTVHGDLETSIIHPLIGFLPRGWEPSPPHPTPTSVTKECMVSSHTSLVLSGLIF